MKPKSFIKENILPVEANRYAKKSYYNLLLNRAFSRVAAAAATRRPDASMPATWEFSGFSQNGEDGIIDHLLSGLKDSNKYFIEIGSGDGLENNTAYLAHIRKFAGMQIEADIELYDDALITKTWLTETLNYFVDESTVENILEKALYKNPDVFSIDIDGMDYYITKLLLEKGLLPKIIVCEYNSAFGPSTGITLPYNPTFNMFTAGHPYLYYGVSLAGWQKLLATYNYRFITVESSGVNAFFIQPSECISGFTDHVEGIGFKENIHQLRMFRKNWEAQFEIIKDLPFIEI